MGGAGLGWGGVGSGGVGRGAVVRASDKHSNKIQDRGRLTLVQLSMGTIIETMSVFRRPRLSRVAREVCRITGSWWPSCSTSLLTMFCSVASV